MTTTEFIENVLIREVKAIQQEHGHHYISFGLISQGIEFLGACLDNHPFNAEKRSSKRFNRCIRELFPAEYHRFVNKSSKKPFDLYGNLRCGLLHVFIPGPDLEIIQEAEVNDYGKHLEVKNFNGKERLILVSQRLMTDFENACNQVISKIDTKEIDNQKVYNNILSTSKSD